jgi:hypothetical protein
VAGGGHAARRTSSGSTPRHHAPARVGGVGHIAGFTDPLVDCKSCKQRFRADHVRRAPVPSAAASSPRRGSSTSCSRRSSGPVEDTAHVAYPPPETAQSMFVNFRNVVETSRLKLPVRHRADRPLVPQRDHARELPLPHPRVRADGARVSSSVRARTSTGSSTGRTLASAGTPTSASRATGSGSAPRRRRARHYAKACVDVEYAFPSAGPSSRGSRTAPTST